MKISQNFHRRGDALPYKLRKKLGPVMCNFIEEIIDGMQDWVRVINRDSTIIFVNKPMREALGYNIIGQKCYELLGRSTRCQNCVSRLDNDNCICCKEETINGRTYSITSSPFKSQGEEPLDAVIEVLHDITELKQMSSELEKQNERMKEDLNMARQLQVNLLPKNQAISDKIGFSYIYKPCEMLGGDFLDIFTIDDDHVGIYIADVSGHGVTASMLTMFLRAAIDKTLLSPSKALTQINKLFGRNGFDNELYIAVFYAIINITDLTITFSNAGLNVCPILYGEDRFEILRASGIPISNWFENPNYDEIIVDLKAKDRLFFYTDGIIEIRNEQKEQFGEERAVEYLVSSKFSLSETLTQLCKKADAFMGTGNLNQIVDDITVALVEIK